MTVEQVSPSVFVETGFLGSNDSAIVTPDGLVLIDAPHKPTDAKAWAQTVSALGEVRYLVNTDHHPDHTIGNRWLPGTTVSYRGTRETLENAAPTREYLRDLFGRIDPAAVPLVDSYEVRLPEITYTGELSLYVGGRRVDLYFVPGHTANNTVIHLPDEGVVFTGDNVCSAGLPSFQDSELHDWFAALDFIDSLAPRVIVPGHGDIGGPELVGRFRELGRELISEVAAGMRNGTGLATLADRIRFPDNIHVDTEAYVGYPDDLIETFQRNTITRLHRDLGTDPELATR
jgi:cyclase